MKKPVLIRIKDAEGIAYDIYSHHIEDVRPRKGHVGSLTDLLLKHGERLVIKGHAALVLLRIALAVQKVT